MNKLRSFSIVGALLATLFLSSGCATVAKITEPVMGLAVEDAKATLVWIDEQVAAGNLSPEQAEMAKACPEAVIALNVLREGMAEGETPDGFKGLIYFGTIKKYGGTERDALVRHITDIAATCSPLLPHTKLMEIF